jgi:hypothetical protein
MYDAYASTSRRAGVVGAAVERRAPPLGPRLQPGEQGYASDYGAGKLYLVDKTVYTDNGAAIGFEVDTRHFFKDYDRVTVDELSMDLETGVGLAVGQGVDPQVMVQVSRDGGRTFGAEIWHSLGAVGRIHDAHRARRCGTARDFVFGSHDGPGEVRARRPWHARERRAGANGEGVGRCRSTPVPERDEFFASSTRRRRRRDKLRNIVARVAWCLRGERSSTRSSAGGAASSRRWKTFDFGNIVAGGELTTTVSAVPGARRGIS